MDRGRKRFVAVHKKMSSYGFFDQNFGGCGIVESLLLKWVLRKKTTEMLRFSIFYKNSGYNRVEAGQIIGLVY